MKPMPPSFSMPRLGRRIRRSLRIRIALIYALAGGIWILLSDRLMLALTGQNLERMALISMYKGWIFVGLTSLLLMLVLPRDEMPDEVVPRVPGLRRLTFAFLGLAAVATLMGWGIFRLQERNLLRDCHRNLAAIGTVKQGQIERWFDSLEKQSRYATANSFLAREVEAWLKEGGGPGNRESAIRNRLNALLSAAGYQGIQVLDLQGSARLQLGQITPCTGNHDRPTPLQERFHWSQDRIPHLLQHMTVPVTLIRGGLERPVAQLRIEANPAPDLLSRLSAWPGATRSGRTLLFEIEDKTLIRLHPGPGPDGQFRFFKAVEPLPEGSVFGIPVESSTPRQGRGERGDSVLASLWRLDGLPFTLAIIQDREEVEAPLRNLALGLTLGIFLLVISVALILRTGWRQHRALWELRSRMEAEKRLEVEVAMARDFYLEVLEGLPNPCCRWEPEAGFRSFNRAWRLFTGRTLEQENGEGWLEGLHPDRAAEIRQQLSDAIATRSAFSLEFELAHRDQSHHWMAFHGVPLFRKEGEFAGFVFTGFDLQSVKEVEQELRRTRDLYAALTLTNQAIAKAKEGQGLFQTVCDIAVDFGHLPLAWIGLIDRGQKRVIPIVHSGPAQAYMDQNPFSFDPEEEASRGPVAQAVLKGGPQVVNRFQEDPRTRPWHKAAQACGIQASAAFPLRQEGELVGVLAVYASKQDFFGTEETDLLAEMADDLTLALDGLQADARRAEAEAALKESESKFRHLLESQGEGFATVDPQENFTFANPAAETVFGVGPGGLLGRNLAEFLSPQSFHFIQAQSLGRARGARNAYELEVIRSGGDARTLLVTATPQFDAVGTYLGSNGIFRDITDRKRTERALRESERNLAQAQALARLGSWTWPRSAEVPEWSMELFHILGLKSAAGPLPQDRFLERVPSPDRDELASALALAWERGIGFEMDFPWSHPQGGLRVLHAVVEAVMDPSLGVVELRGCFRDATLEREAQEQLRRAQHLVEHSPEAILGSTREGRITFVNPMACRSLGYSREELLQRSIWELWPTPEPERWTALWERMVREGPLAFEMVHCHRSGESFPVELQTTLVEFGNSQVAYAFIRDISERRAMEAARLCAEQRLRESEEKYRAIVENTSDTVMRFDREARHLFVNEAVAKVVDQPREAFIGRTHEELGFDPDLCALWSTQISRVFAEGTPLETEFDLPSSRGVSTIDWRLFPEFDDTGAVTSVLGIGRDITERRRANDALRKAYSRLEDLMKAVNEATLVLITDLQGRILHANARFLELHGRTLGEVMGQNPRIFSSGGHSRDFFERLWETLRIGNVWHDELRNLTRDGRQVWLDATILPCRGEQGALQQYLLLATDITARKEAESRLMAISAERAALLEAASVAKVVPWTLDMSQGNLQVGESAAEVLGRPASAFRHLPGLLRELLRPEERSLLAQAQAEAKAGRASSFEVMLQHASGRKLWTRWTLAQHDHLLCGVIQDITEPHELQSQLLQSQKLESLGTLLSGISHDFNNLLMAILGYTEVLSLTQGLPENHLRGLEVIRRAAHRGSSLVNQLLRFSRKSAPVRSLLNLNDIATEVLNLLKLPGDHRIELQVELDPELPPTWADAGQMIQVAMNLAVNARDAIPGRGRLTLRTGQERLDSLEMHAQGKAPGPHVYIEVEDTGTGMPREVAARVFEPFFTTKGVGKGTGLGLSVVHGIVETHRGTIRLNSRPGEGTCFRVLLPLVADPHVEEDPASEGIGPSLNLLLVDDPGPDRDTIEELLTVLGHEVHTVQASDEPFEREGQASPELVLLHPESSLGGPWLARFEAAGLDLPLILAREQPGAPWSGRLQPHALIRWPFRAGELLDALHRFKGA